MKLLLSGQKAHGSSRLKFKCILGYINFIEYTKYYLPDTLHDIEISILNFLTNKLFSLVRMNIDVENYVTPSVCSLLDHTGNDTGHSKTGNPIPTTHWSNITNPTCCIMI
jgi:hypothetical protein